MLATHRTLAAAAALLLATVFVRCSSGNTPTPAPTWGDSMLDPVSQCITDDGDVAAARAVRQQDIVKQCMADQGFAFSATVSRFVEKNPSATSEDAAVQRLKAEEITQALADRDCADDVNFVNRRLATLAELEKGLHRRKQEGARRRQARLDQ